MIFKHLNTSIREISTFRKTITLIFIFIAISSGILVTSLSVTLIYNYLNAWTFGLTLGIIGYIFGVFVAKKLKHVWAVTPKLKYKKTGLEYFIALGFVGPFMLTGHFVNQAYSKPLFCGNYIIKYKNYVDGGKNGDLKIELYVDIFGKTEKIHCNKPYYEKVNIGEKINICYMSSPFGSDYYLIKDN
jgi:hypothetical protein